MVVYTYWKLMEIIWVSQNEVCGMGSLPQGSVSRVCFVVCFGGLFRTVLLPRTI